VGVPPFVLMPPRSPVVGGLPYEDMASHEQEAAEYLEAVARPLRARGLDVKAVVETHTNPALAVLEYAQANDIDLIAMSTHGRVGFSRIALGHRAEGRRGRDG